MYSFDAASSAVDRARYGYVEDAPAEDNYGRKFIVLMREDLGDALEKARLAGLTMEFIHEDPDDNSPIPA